MKKIENPKIPIENSAEKDRAVPSTARLCCAQDWTALSTRATDVSHHNFIDFGDYIGAITFDSNPPTYAYLNLWKQTMYNLEHFPDNPEDLPLVEITDAIAGGRGQNPYAPGTKTYHQMLDDDFADFGSLLTWDQKDIINTYCTGLELITNATDATQQYNSAIFNINSRLFEPDITETRVIVEVIHRTTLEYLSNNQYVFAALRNETELNASSGGCVNWRDVFRDAVWSGFTGGVSGVIAGAAGGTVVLPGIGTVSGALGVGILGLAGGFLAGAANSAASQWFWNCLLESPVSDPGLNCQDLDFSLENQEYCNTDQQFLNLTWYLIDDN